MNKEILNKYLNNSCSEQEFDEFASWVSQNNSDKKLKNLSFQQWKNITPELKDKHEKKYSIMLDKIHHQINLKHHPEEDVNIISIASFTKWMSRAAAILFLPLLGILLFLYQNNNIHFDGFANVAVDTLEIISPIGSRAMVQLTDGTEVALNYGSQIIYPSSFVGNTREVTLIGEAFFDVAHNPEKPFIVKTEKLNVIAVGTSFNVHSYPGDDAISTTLVEGKVLLSEHTGTETKQIGSMKPGQHVIYNLKTGTISSSEGNIDKYIAWRDGKMIFDNTSINEVVHELSRKFNVDIEVADDIRYLTYTVTFAEDPLFLILDLMTEITPITYKRLPRKKMPDGSFSKQKISIEKRKEY